MRSGFVVGDLVEYQGHRASVVVDCPTFTGAAMLHIKMQASGETVVVSSDDVQLCSRYARAVDFLRPHGVLSQAQTACQQLVVHVLVQRQRRIRDCSQPVVIFLLALTAESISLSFS